MIPPIGVLKQFSFSFSEFISTFGIPYRMLCSSEKIFFLNYIGLHFSSKMNEDDKFENDDIDSETSQGTIAENITIDKILGINENTSRNSSQMKTVQEFKDYYYRRIFPGNEYKTPLTFSLVTLGDNIPIGIKFTTYSVIRNFQKGLFLAINP